MFDGQVAAVRLSPDLAHAVSDPIILFRASDAPWRGPQLSQPGCDGGNVTDGPFLHRMNNGSLIMLWSNYCPDGYAVGYARSLSGGIRGPWVQEKTPLYAFDAEVRSQYGCFAGVDEAGRGPLCGPVCVAACILDPENPVYGINDSKKLTEKKREALFDEICEKALAYRIIFVGPEVIDRENILNATMGGMQQAVEELDIVPNLVLVDGNRTPAGLQIPAQPVVKGDATSASIGAASVLAKVSRDRYMLELDKQYPQYQLAKHKGYPTKLHYELIAQYGIQPFYRRSFLKKQGYWPESGK